MSYIMHNKRMNCLDFIKRYLKEKKKVNKQTMRVEIMKRFNFSSTTADRYIRDIIVMGIAKTNSNHLTLVTEEKHGSSD